MSDIDELRENLLARWDGLRKKVFNLDAVLTEQEQKDFATLFQVCPRCFKNWPLCRLEYISLHLWCETCDFELEPVDDITFTVGHYDPKFRREFIKKLTSEKKK